MQSQGIIVPSWPDEYKYLNFVKQPITDEEIKKWNDAGFYLDNYTGSTYDNRNPMPDWVESIGRYFPELHDKTYTIYKMDSMEIMPPHVDHFNRYSELFCKDKTKIYRVVLFLEKWQPGHYFELNKKGIVNWLPGQWFMWRHDTEHAASNIGNVPRYTLQITGHV